MLLLLVSYFFTGFADQVKNRNKRFTSKIPLPKKMKKLIDKKMKSYKKTKHGLDSDGKNNTDIRFERDVEGMIEITCDNEISRVIAKQYKRSAVRWLINGFALTIQLERMTYQFNILRIQNLVPEDQGIYTCQMEYEPKEFKTVALYTLVTNPGKEIQVMESRPLTLDCPSHTLHHMVYAGDKVWVLNGDDFTNPEPYQNQSSITFEEASKNLTGNWSCVVRDTNDIEWKLFNYVVIVNPPPSLYEEVYFFAIDNPKTSIGFGLFVLFIVLVIAVTGMYFVEKSQQKSKKQAEDFKAKIGKMTDSNDPEITKLINDIAYEGLDTQVVDEYELDEATSKVLLNNTNENSRLLPQYSFNGSFMSICSSDTSSANFQV